MDLPSRRLGVLARELSRGCAVEVAVAVAVSVVAPVAVETARERVAVAAQRPLSIPLRRSRALRTLHHTAYTSLRTDPKF
jgi:hypothetical protein